MKRLLAILLTLILLLAVATACGKEPATPVEVGASVSVVIPENVFEKGTEVKAEAVTEGVVYQRAQAAVNEVAEQFCVFELTAVKDEAEVQPNGTLTVNFPIPTTYSTNVTVYYVDDEGKAEALPTTIDAETRTAVVELTHFSTYVLADKGEETTTTTETDETTTTETTVDTTTAATTTVATTVTTTAATTVATTTTAATIKATTTTAAPTATTTVATTTTTTVPTTSFKDVEYSMELADADWEYMCIADNGELQAYYIYFKDESYEFLAGMPALDQMTQDELDQQVKEDPYSFIKYEDVYYCIGRGDGDGFASIKEESNVITITDFQGGVMVIHRIDNMLLEVISNNTAMDVPVGAQFHVYGM